MDSTTHFLTGKWRRTSRSGVGTEDAISKAGAGSAVIHDDAGNMPTDAQRAAFYPEKVAPLNAGAGSAIIHDDAGNVDRNTGSAVIHDDPWNLHPNYGEHRARTSSADVA
jgi:hypothetical protein